MNLLSLHAVFSIIVVPLLLLLQPWLVQGSRFSDSDEGGAAGDASTTEAPVAEHASKAVEAQEQHTVQQPLSKMSKHEQHEQPHILPAANAAKGLIARTMNAFKNNPDFKENREVLMKASNAVAQAVKQASVSPLETEQKMQLDPSYAEAPEEYELIPDPHFTDKRAFSTATTTPGVAAAVSVEPAAKAASPPSDAAKAPGPGISAAALSAAIPGAPVSSSELMALIGKATAQNLPVSATHSSDGGMDVDITALMATLAGKQSDKPKTDSKATEQKPGTPTEAELLAKIGVPENSKEKVHLDQKLEAPKSGAPVDKKRPASLLEADSSSESENEEQKTDGSSSVVSLEEQAKEYAEAIWARMDDTHLFEAPPEITTTALPAASLAELSVENHIEHKHRNMAGLVQLRKSVMALNQTSALAEKAKLLYKMLEDQVESAEAAQQHYQQQAVDEEQAQKANEEAQREAKLDLQQAADFANRFLTQLSYAEQMNSSDLRQEAAHLGMQAQYAQERAKTQALKAQHAAEWANESKVVAERGRVHAAAEVELVSVETKNMQQMLSAGQDTQAQEAAKEVLEQKAASLLEQADAMYEEAQNPEEVSLQYSLLEEGSGFEGDAPSTDALPAQQPQAAPVVATAPAASSLLQQTATAAVPAAPAAMPTAAVAAPMDPARVAQLAQQRAALEAQLKMLDQQHQGVASPVTAAAWPQAQPQVLSAVHAQRV